MKILVDVRHLSTGGIGGVAEYTRRLLPFLFAQAPEDEFVLLTSGRTPNAASLPCAPNVSHRHLPLPNKVVNGVFGAFGVPTLARAFGVDGDALFLPNLAFIPRYDSLPRVVMVHDLTWKLLPDCFSAKMRAWHRAVNPGRVIGGAASVLVPSRSAAGDLKRFFPEVAERVSVVPHGVGEEFSPIRLASDHGVRSRLRLPPRYALFVGTIEPRKNVSVALEAVRRYRKQSGDRLPLVVAGAAGWRSKPILRELEDARKSGLAVPLGPVRSEDLPALYRGASAFLWPSKYEGFGLPVLEAMASGVPVVTSGVAAMPEVCGNAAIFVHPDNPEDAARALELVLKDVALGERLRASGLERAKAFSWKTSAQETLKRLHLTTSQKTA